MYLVFNYIDIWERMQKMYDENLPWGMPWTRKRTAPCTRGPAGCPSGRRSVPGGNSFLSWDSGTRDPPLYRYTLYKGKYAQHHLKEKAITYRYYINTSTSLLYSSCASDKEAYWTKVRWPFVYCNNKIH